MNRQELFTLILCSILLVAVVNCTNASEYLPGYEYPDDPEPVPEPDLSVEECKPISEWQAREEYFERLWYFVNEIAIEQVLEAQRLEYLKAQKELEETTQY